TGTPSSQMRSFGRKEKSMRVGWLIPTEGTHAPTAAAFRSASRRRQGLSATLTVLGSPCQPGQYAGSKRDTSRYRSKVWTISSKCKKSVKTSRSTSLHRLHVYSRSKFNSKFWAWLKTLTWRFHQISYAVFCLDFKCTGILGDDFLR